MMDRIIRQSVEMLERHQKCIDEIHSSLKRLHYVEAVDDSSSVWDIEHPELKFETFKIPARMSHLMRIRLSKAKKTETRKRWLEIANIIADISMKYPFVHPKLLTSIYYEMSQDAQVEGMVLIF